MKINVFEIGSWLNNDNICVPRLVSSVYVRYVRLYKTSRFVLILLLCSTNGGHIVAALSICSFICPAHCRANNFETTYRILMKLDLYVIVYE